MKQQENVRIRMQARITAIGMSHFFKLSNTCDGDCVGGDEVVVVVPEEVWLELCSSQQVAHWPLGCQASADSREEYGRRASEEPAK